MIIDDLCFEILQKCSNNCKFCSSCSSMNAINFIEYELFEKVIVHIMNNGGLKEISISGGEPFLHKDLLKMIKLCKSYGIKTNLFTSGIIENPYKNLNLSDYSKNDAFILGKIKELDFYSINKEVFIELKEAGLDKIVFDFQSADCDIYNNLMGTKNNMTNLLNSMLHAKFAGLYVEAHFIPMKSNINEIEDILELCEIGEFDRLSILKFVPQGRGKLNKNELALSLEELNKFCEKVESLRTKYKVDIRLGIPVTKEDEHLCTAGHNKLSIRYDGMVLPCVAFKEMDNKELESIFIENEIPFKTFSIRDNLDMLTAKEGSNKIPICKQVYKKLIL